MSLNNPNKPPYAAGQMAGDYGSPKFLTHAGRNYPYWAASGCLEMPLNPTIPLESVSLAAANARHALARIVAEHRRK